MARQPSATAPGSASPEADPRDHDAIAALYDRLAGRIHAYALQRLREPDLAAGDTLLDMTTGEIVTDPVSAGRDDTGTDAWITGGGDTGVYVVQVESGRMLVLDGPGGQAFEMAAPEEDSGGWPGVAIGVSPNGGCLVYTRVGEGEEPGTSWIAPLEPDGEWTELPFELAMWVEMPTSWPQPAASPVAAQGSSVVVAGSASETGHDRVARAMRPGESGP